MPLPLHVTSHPREGARPVIALHGLASNGATDWAGWADTLTDAGLSPYIVDLPGHGASVPIESADQARADRIIAAVAELADRAAHETGVDQVDVIGYSLGARLAWDVPGASSRVRRLALGGLSPAEPFGALDLDALRRVAVDGDEAPDELTAMIAGMISGPGSDAASLVNVVAGLAAVPFDPTAAPQVPTLLVAGDSDPMSQGADAVAEALPQGQFERVPGDHLGALASADFRRLVLDFLRADERS